MRSAHRLVLAIPAVIALAAPLVAGEDPSPIVRWEVTPSAAACLGIEARVDDLYVLEIPRAANVTLQLTSLDPSAGCDLLLMAVDDQSKPRIIAESNRIAELL